MELTRYIPLNFAMMANGYNWITLTLMVAIAVASLALIFPTVAAQPGANPS